MLCQALRSAAYEMGRNSALKDQILPPVRGVSNLLEKVQYTIEMLQRQSNLLLKNEY